MSVEERVHKVIEEQLGIDESEITEDASFEEDLGADSLDLAELVMGFEEEFDVIIPDEEAEQITTVGEAVDKLESLQ
ncbi:MAG: acyl carrier protein [bacterium]